MQWPKKIHTENLITKKNSRGSKFPLPPHNFSKGPSLTEDNPLSAAGRVYLGYLQIEIDFTLEPSFYNSSRFTYSIINYAFLVLASFNSLSVFYPLLK